LAQTLYRCRFNRECLQGELNGALRVHR
jgi:hypothetical protein